MTAPFPATRIVAVGRLGRGPEADLFARYCARVRPAPTLTEIPEARGKSPAEARRREAEAIAAALDRDERLIALDQGGRVVDTAGFARLLDPGRKVCFALGGPEGLDQAILARADTVVSLGAMTWPHLLARVMLSEQVFRAYSIAAGHPYHRAARP